jgi:hypothetical protein
MELEFEFGGVEVEIEIKGWHGAVTLLGVGLVAATVARELSLPASERKWHGRLFDVVPYDLRPPSIGRLRQRLWNPDEPNLLVPTAFGIGWTVNLAAPVSWARGEG